MKKLIENLKLYAITNRTTNDINLFLDQIEEALNSGISILQLREKNLEYNEFLDLAHKVKKLCDKYNVNLIINDNYKIAKQIKAYGVHIGQEDSNIDKVREYLGDEFIIGVTAKTIEQAKEAQENTADYLGSGALFASPTKKDAVKISKKELNEICDAVDIPVVAIGGINKDNILKLKDTKVSGFAFISAIFNHEDIRTNVKEIKKKINMIFNSNTINTSLTIAGSDSSGGAGIQADLKTMLAHKVYGMSAITALTAQNTTGVQDIMEISPKFLESQLISIFEDIYPDSIKTGMISNTQLIEKVVEILKKYDAKNIVVDPVMVTTSGTKLISDEAIDTLKDKLLPIASLVTPNIPEANILSNIEIKDSNDMKKAAKIIYENYNCNTLVKGGHSINDANDLFYNGKDFTWIKSERINNDNTHGTGCTLSSAIASNLAKGLSLLDSIKQAKTYITKSLRQMLDLGNGKGPLDHSFDINGKYENE